LNVIDRLPDREYNNLADVDKSIGSIIRWFWFSRA
jgi:hypothetical protein